MTDRLKTRTGSLTIQRYGTPGETLVIVSKTADPRASAVIVPTAELLAMIDRSDPYAMRSYLRERSDLIDAPDESCSTLEDMLPADLAAEAARYRVPDVPEADSTEDVDEHPEPDPIERRLYVIDRLARSLRAGTDAELVTALADWVLDR